MPARTLAFEIGTEEIPAFDLAAATKQLPPLASRLLAEASIPYGEISAYSSPRRLIVLVHDVEEMTPEKSETFKGPKASIAYDGDGNPTKSAEGFARGKGATTEDLFVEDGYVHVCTFFPSQRVEGLLAEVLPSIIRGISWPKSQRWGTHDEYFSRPVRWLVALFGADVIPLSFAGVASGRCTFGHRFMAPGPFRLASADDLLPTLCQAYVIPSEEEREKRLWDEVASLEEKTGLSADLPRKTLQEVINLTEYPTVLLGTFDEMFLEVPQEITVDAMLVHQRYFPMFSSDGSLSNTFLITSNGNPDCAANIVDGNQRVVAARLYDAKFFYDEDRRQPLSSYVDRLDEVVFQEQLGTMRDKTRRIERMSAHLCAAADLDTCATDDAVRAAHLCKADLVTSAVVEFTSVQGIMGSYYARSSGENDIVSQAIADHYRPRHSGDTAPKSPVGKAVSVADKLDTICGLFAIDQAPTGSSDPFALRRCALGILSIMTGSTDHDPLCFPLVPSIEASLNLYAEEGIAFEFDEVSRAVIDFFITRTKVLLRDEGCAADAIEAVLSVGVDEPLVLIARVRSLEAARADSPQKYENLATAFARAYNLADPSLGKSVDKALLDESSHALFDSCNALATEVSDALADGDYAQALGSLSSLRDPIDAFFRDVLVIDPDPDVRENNLRLLNRFCALFQSVADFSKLAKPIK